jgi:hypothetical protein
MTRGETIILLIEVGIIALAALLGILGYGVRRPGPPV